MFFPFGKGGEMDSELQEAIDKLESLQMDMLFWKRRTKSRKTKSRISMYDAIIESVIDSLYDKAIEE